MATISAPVEKMKAAHKVLAEYTYELRPVERGYANRTLYINLDDYTIQEKPVTEEMKERFTGGKGFALWLLWNAVKDDTKWDDPENELLIASGPISGNTAYPGSGKSTVVFISPLTKQVVDSNVGGYFGPYMKFSGFDVLEIQGKAKEDVIIFIDGDNGKVTIESAPLEALDSYELKEQLAEMYKGDSKKGKLAISTITAGPAAEHIWYGALNFSWYDVRRKEMRIKQAARGGSATVFRDKKIKGIVVRFSNLRGDSNHPADMSLVKKAGKRINTEIWELDDKQNQMRKVGTPYLSKSWTISTCSPSTTTNSARTPTPPKSTPPFGRISSPKACPTAAGLAANSRARTAWTIST